MKRISLSLITLATGLALNATVWAGVDYIKEHEQYQARDQGSASSKKGPSEKQSFQHKSKYHREQMKDQGEAVPTSDKPKTGQKYERPDWAK
jgi:hypothetical protein